MSGPPAGDTGGVQRAVRPRADVAHRMLAVFVQPDTIGQAIGIAS